jgi:DNA-binding FadR family transcriptional regulator
MDLREVRVTPTGRSGARTNGVRIPKTAEVVAATLRNQIVRGELAAGDSLPLEPELIAMFNISRPTMREAFRILEAEQLIVIRRGSRGGAQVLAPDIASASEQVGLVMQFRGVTVDAVYQARALMESSAISALSGTPSDEVLAGLRDNLEEARIIVECESDDVALHQVSRRFHSLIVDASGNGALTIFNDMICDIVDRGGAVFERSRTPEARVMAQRAAYKSHLRIYGLLSEGRLDAADDLWRRHVDAVADGLASANPAGSTVLELLA